MKVESKMAPKNTKGTKPKMVQSQTKPIEKKNFEKKQQPVKAAETQSKPRPKLDQVKYVMNFGSIYDGFCEITELSYDINELTREISELLPETVDEAMDMLLNIFNAHMPSYDNRKNMHYDINVSANKCSLKTDRYISFGWYIKNTRQEDASFTTQYIFHITVFGDKGELVKELVNHGWMVDTYNK